jgi:hypothetical protein
LSYDIIRIEYDKDGCFEDRPTFFIPERQSFTDEVKMTLGEDNGNYSVEIGDLQVLVPKCGKELQDVVMLQDGREVYRYRTMKNKGELPPVGKTPFVFPVTDSPRIVCPSAGYSAESAKCGEGFEIQKTARDVYLLVCRNDAKKLRSLFVSLT